MICRCKCTESESCIPQNNYNLLPQRHDDQTRLSSTVLANLQRSRHHCSPGFMHPITSIAWARHDLGFLRPTNYIIWYITFGVVEEGAGGGSIMTLGMAVEAVKGAVREAWASQAPAAVLLSLLVIIARELAGTALMAGYGVYAFWVYSTLPKWKKMGSKSKEKNVAIARNVQYGQTRRNLLDVYVPKSKLEPDLKPVVLFVHGGVWASGDKWQFSPLGAFLAEEGVVAVLAQYTLYPKVLAVEQVSEMSEALSWTMDNVAQYGGDPNRVFLMGHSSGSHLCAMVLWERACRRLENAQHPRLDALDMRIPAGYIGLAGVYNIGEHFKYELKRGVGAISCMRPAMGWEPTFDSMSPSLLFESLLNQPRISFGGVDLMPPTLFIVSHKDITVPPTSSLAFNKLLSTELGCQSRVVVYDVLSHVDFVIWHQGWGRLKAHVGPYLEDILNFVTLESLQQ